MARIVISENTSLDGVVQDPTGEEGFRQGGWFTRIGDADREAWAEVEYRESLDAEALLLGRRSDEFFAARWLSRTGDWADRLNSMPKYVVSSRGQAPRWSNTTLLTGDVVAEVSRLKRELAGDIVVYGSGQLSQALLEHDLVDELRLMICPFVLGEGERLFTRSGDLTALRLADTRAVGDGIVRLDYQRA